MHAADDARLNVWARQPKKFFERATIDLDGTLVVTTGECKAGMDISYKGTWGYHPLLVSLAETGEVLRLVNRCGKPPQSRRRGGRSRRGDCLVPQGGLSQDRASRRHGLQPGRAAGRLGRRRGTFYFGFKALPNLEQIADELPETAWKKLRRPPRYEVKTKPRRKPLHVKPRIVREAGIRSAPAPERRVRRNSSISRLACEQGVPHDRGPQEHFAREGRDAVVRRGALLLLHHQRREDRSQRKWSSRPTTVATRKT